MGCDARWLRKRADSAPGDGIHHPANLQRRFVCAQGSDSFSHRSASLSSCARTSERPTGTSSGSTGQDRNGCRSGHSAGTSPRNRSEPVGQRHSGQPGGEGGGQGRRGPSGAGPVEPRVHGGEVAGRWHGRNCSGANRQSCQSDDGSHVGLTNKSHQSLFLTQRAGVHPLR